MFQNAIELAMKYLRIVGTYRVEFRIVIFNNTIVCLYFPATCRIPLRWDLYMGAYVSQLKCGSGFAAKPCS